MQDKSMKTRIEELQRSLDELKKSQDELVHEVKALKLSIYGVPDKATFDAKMILLAAEKRLLDRLCADANHDRNDYGRIDEVLMDIKEGTASAAVTTAWNSLKKYWPQRQMRRLLQEQDWYVLPHPYLGSSSSSAAYCALSKTDVEEMIRGIVPDDLIDTVVMLHTLTATNT